MNKASKIAIGIGIASGTLLAAWLLTGSRKEKTKKLITKGTEKIKASINKEKAPVSEDSEVNYV